MAGDANVRVVVSAITEAAEQALEGVGDEMSGMADDAITAQTGLDQVSDEMGESARSAAILQAALDEMSEEMREGTLSAQLLQNALDEVGDESLQAAAKSSAASGAFTSLSVSSEGAALSVGSLSTAFTLSLIPAVLTAATVLAPVVALFTAMAAGAAAVAGAFGLVVGSGILAFGQKKAQQNQEELAQTERLIKQYESMKERQGELTAQGEDRLQQLRKKKKELEDQQTATGALAGVLGDLKDELTPLIVDFGQEFIPLIAEAVDAIPDVVEEMLNAVGGTDQFREALRDFGAAAAQVLPALTGFMFELARDALPVVREFFGWLMQNGPGIWDSITASIEELEPEFRNLLDALIEASPTLLEFGTNVGEVLLPALTGLIRAANGFMETVNEMDGGMQNLVISALLLAPVLVKIAGIASTVATALGFGGLTGALMSLITWLGGLLPSAFQLGMAFQLIVEGVSAATAAIASSPAALAALGAAIGLIGVKILDMLGFFDLVAEAGQMVGEVLGRDMVDSILVLLSVLTLGLFPLIAALGAAIVELVRGDISGAVDAFNQVMGIFASAFGNVADMIISGLADLGAWFADVFSAIGGILLEWATTGLDILVQFFTKDLPQMAVQGLNLLLAFGEAKMNEFMNIFDLALAGIHALFVSGVQAMINAAIDALNNFLSTVDDVANTVEDVTGKDLGGIGQLDRVQLDQPEVKAGQRTTDVQQILQDRQQGGGGADQVVENTEVNVDVGGDLNSDPFSFSRNLADQVNREKRSNSGT